VAAVAHGPAVSNALTKAGAQEFEELESSDDEELSPEEVYEIKQ